MKVLLISVDGMRPDAIKDVPFVKELMKKSTYTLNAQTVMPSVTLPCHMSMFHSVDPGRHGTTTNVYSPQVRPVKGLMEVLSDNGKRNAYYFNWGEIRDVTGPRSYVLSYYANPQKETEMFDEEIYNCALNTIKPMNIDFAFLYLGRLDGVGHKYGWMSEEYMEEINEVWKKIEGIMNHLGDEYTVIITTDHGGHARIHGEDIPEDMTIPIFICGKNIENGKILENANIMDIPPTVTKLFGMEPDKDWEGKSLI